LTAAVFAIREVVIGDFLAKETLLGFTPVFAMAGVFDTPGLGCIFLTAAGFWPEGFFADAVLGVADADRTGRALRASAFLFCVGFFAIGSVCVPLPLQV
jgi:hypothetical protein